MDTDAVDEVLRQVWARRDLPPPARRREIREAAGVSMRDMGEAVGVTHSTIRNWEAGGKPRRQHVDTYRRLLRSLEEIVELRKALEEIPHG